LSKIVGGVSFRVEKDLVVVCWAGRDFPNQSLQCGS
jgi:hypothetical protein